MKNHAHSMNMAITTDSIILRECIVVQWRVGWAFERKTNGAPDTRPTEICLANIYISSESSVFVLHALAWLASSAEKEKGGSDQQPGGATGGTPLNVNMKVSYCLE